MMDCGCGSYEQMVRFFHDKVETELAKIKMIFISHIHLDHTLVSDLLIINMQCIYNKEIQTLILELLQS